MKLTLEALAAHLAGQLLPVYLVSGDEPLLTGEALDAIRERARGAGATAREVFFIERGNAVWDAVLQAAQSLSLFAEQRIVEIRMPSGKPGTVGAAALLKLLEAAGSDLLVLIATDRLDRDSQEAAWVRAVQSRGAWLPVWPVERARLPQWLRGRLAAAGLTADAEALSLLAERSEGNLLAAKQEIDKLALLLPRGSRVGIAEVIAGSTDAARFDVFQLGEALRSRDAARALRILASLRAAGTEPTLVLWAVLREIRGAAAEGARARRWLARAAAVDRLAKGLASGDPWDELAWLALELAGNARVPLLPPMRAEAAPRG
ncbi:MAG TPA: DNA polymerase III subunit delta [Steroidobacteraceae bacterium]|jgi:DNA polymerase-3 subunit delta|nr:DNA polymerase III subunit delta [Steroidobacteraceae bacterium]